MNLVYLYFCHSIVFNCFCFDFFFFRYFLDCFLIFARFFFTNFPIDQFSKSIRNLLHFELLKWIVSLFDRKKIREKSKLKSVVSNFLFRLFAFHLFFDCNVVQLKLILEYCLYYCWIFFVFYFDTLFLLFYYFFIHKIFFFNKHFSHSAIGMGTMFLSHGVILSR